MAYPTKLGFNPKPSTVLHIDLNSCFATVEQQANPHLRGKPVAVAAYTTPGGCILAPSVEAKAQGIKVGMRVGDGKLLCPGLVVLAPDPWKYRGVHLRLREILRSYTNNLNPKSIDEFVLNLEGYPILEVKTLSQVAQEIKKKIKTEIGEWITVSIGLAPNRFLAKLAGNLNKPDGLDEINIDNFKKIYQDFELVDLPGIKIRNTARLNSMGIHSVIDFYQAPIWRLKAAFNSILGYYWHVRLHGWEVDDVEYGRRSYGNSYALPKPLVTPHELSPILSKLVTKMSSRLRSAGYKARGVHVRLSYRDWSYWHKGITYPKVLFDTRDVYKEAFKIMSYSPYKKPVRELAVSCFGLLRSKASQLELFDDIEKKEKLAGAIDRVNERWGNFVITPARMLAASNLVPDRISYGGVKELEEFTLKS